MAEKNTFRSALNGFNREDVVHYIEYLNSKHTAQINQLESENAELRSKLESIQAQPVAAENEDASPCPDCAQLQQQLDAALAEIEELKNVPEGDVTTQELEGIENILNFEEQFRGCRVIRLEQNYRSTGRILDAANAIIARNQGRTGKT